MSRIAVKKAIHVASRNRHCALSHVHVICARVYNLSVFVSTARSVSQIALPPISHSVLPMSFSANDDLFCQICDTLCATANSAFSLSCANDGCKGHMCFDCMQRAVFPETHKRRHVPTAAVPWRRIHTLSSVLTSPCRNCRISSDWPRSRSAALQSI